MSREELDALKEAIAKAEAEDEDPA
jgi:hypothetical protein